MKIWGLEGIERNECSIPFPSLKLPNKGIVFPFHSIPSYLTSKQGKGENILKIFIFFYSIPFPPPKRSVKKTKQKEWELIYFLCVIKKFRKEYNYKDELQYKVSPRKSLLNIRSH
jgi:hypothetical protein